MTPKPLVFTGPNVLAIMADPPLKTNSRRIMRVQPKGTLKKTRYTNDSPEAYWRDKDDRIFKPPHQPGDIVYVAEGYQISGRKGGTLVSGIYSSDNENFGFISLTHEEGRKWRVRKYPYRKTPGRFMYRSLARTWLEILDVKAERIQDISTEDVIAEGIDVLSKLPFIVPPDTDLDGLVLKIARMEMEKLWNSIHGPDAWKRDDWTWAYTFKRCEKPKEES